MNARTFSAHYSGIRRSPQASHRMAGHRETCRQTAEAWTEDGAGFAAAEPLGRDDLDRLVFGEGDPCASIYLPCGQAAASEGPARLAKLVRMARQELAKLEVRPEDVEALLAPVASLAEETWPWPFEGAGLALFAAPGFFRTVELSAPPLERVAAGWRFTLRPLVGALAPELPFYVLALGPRQVRLIEVGPAESRRIELPRLPERPEGKTDRAHPFGRIHEALAEVLPDRRVPLVLAATEEQAQLYDQAADALAPRAGLLPGDPDLLSDEELAEKARRAMRPHFLAERERELARWRELGAAGRASAALQEVVQAAADGRVEVLFLADQGEGWGCFDPLQRTVEVRTERRAGDEDLLETALRHTLAYGGTVFTLPLDLLPRGAVAAATLRD